MGTSTQLSKRVLVFGGAFDPIHRGHLGIADRIQKQWDYNEVWFVPCLSSRYEKNMADYLERLAMVETAIEEFGNPTFKVTHDEAKAEADGRMYVLAKYLESCYPDAEMDFLIGSDSLQHLDSWYRIDDLRNEFMLLVAQRAGYPDERLTGAMYFPDDDGCDMSSTIAREQLKTDGHSPLLMDGTQKFIKKRGLYV